MCCLLSMCIAYGSMDSCIWPQVSMIEFRKAMPLLGFICSKADSDAVFCSMDPDGSGSIDYKEMQKLLKPRVAAPQAGWKPKVRKIVDGEKATSKFTAKPADASRLHLVPSRRI